MKVYYIGDPHYMAGLHIFFIVHKSQGDANILKKVETRVIDLTRVNKSV